MANSVDEQIWDLLRHLDVEQKQYLLAIMSDTLTSAGMPLRAWFDETTVFRQKLLEAHAQNWATEAQTLLDEVREEASWPRQ